MEESSVADRIYKNSGNSPLIDLIVGDASDVLDVGCGAGDNASLIRQRFPSSNIDGITHSAAEANLARTFMRDCWVFDLEGSIPSELRQRKYDVIIFSHVLEHLREPHKVVSDYTDVLKPNGIILIAVPNILSWRTRMKFLFGNFAYTDAGPLDVTHLRFFTFITAADFLLSSASNLELQSKTAHGSFPLWWLRRYLLTKPTCARIDRWACRRWPNLFGDQVLLKSARR